MMGRLGSHHRLLLGDSGFLGDLAHWSGHLLRRRFLGRRGRKNRLDSWSGGRLGNRSRGRSGSGRGTSTLAPKHLLHLSGVFASVLLAHGGKLISLLLGHAADLGCLSIDSLGSVLEVVVDQLLVGGVDERNEEGDSGGNDGKTPVWHQLDEMIRQESSDASLVNDVSSNTITATNWRISINNLQPQKQGHSRRKELFGPR